MQELPCGLGAPHVLSGFSHDVGLRAPRTQAVTKSLQIGLAKGDYPRN